MARQGRRLGTSLLVVVIVLVGLLFAADRVAAATADRMIAKQAKTELAARQITTPYEPTASVGGFPFLTQVLRGRYDKVTINLRDVTNGGVTLPSLAIVARGVDASLSSLRSGTGRITADTVSGTALLDWVTVRKLLVGNSNVDMSQVVIRHGTGDQIVMTLPIAVAGLHTTLEAVGAVVPEGTALRVHIDRVTTKGTALPPLAQGLLTLAEQQLSFKIGLPALPYQLRVTDVHVSDSGLAVTAVARQVPLSA